MKGTGKIFLLGALVLGAMSVTASIPPEKVIISAQPDVKTFAIDQIDAQVIELNYEAKYSQPILMDYSAVVVERVGHEILVVNPQNDAAKDINKPVLPTANAPPSK